MKTKNLFAFLLILLLTSCGAHQATPSYSAATYQQDIQPVYEDITQSLFSDKDAMISEENIQRILNGKYSLQKNVRVAIVNLENAQSRRSYWNNEDYLSSREKYLNVIIDNLKTHNRIESASLVPQILLPSALTFNAIREAAVRMQADVVLVYSVSGGIYSKYKLFKANEYKSFATTQILMMDVRTGLVPFTCVISKDSQSKKDKEDFNENEAIKRVQEDAVLLTLDDASKSINKFLTDDK